VRGKIRTHYAKWKKKKEAQNGHSQTQKAFEKKQTQKEVTVAPDSVGAIFFFNS